jgi:hypothetical protein
MHSVKRAVSREINLIEGTYVFRWQHSFYDRLLRKEKEFAAYFRYVMNNPSGHETTGFTWSVAEDASLALTTPADESIRNSIKRFLDERIILRRRYYKVKSEADKNHLHRAIAGTDKQIDSLVYDLYNLTDE